MEKHRHIGKLLLPAAVLFLSLSGFSQLKQHSFEELNLVQKKEKRNTVVFIYTDWCRYCHLMKNISLKNKKVMELLNDSFWFVSLNAEEKQDIAFNGHIFRHKATGIHELAEKLGTINGEIVYPALCILNADNEIIFQYSGFLSSKELLKILNEVLVVS